MKISQKKWEKVFLILNKKNKKQVALIYVLPKIELIQP